MTDEEVKRARDGVESTRVERAEGIEVERVGRAEGVESSRLYRAETLEGNRAYRAKTVQIQFAIVLVVVLIAFGSLAYRSEVNSRLIRANAYYSCQSISQDLAAVRTAAGIPAVTPADCGPAPE